jgi:hypothetical protein
MTNLTLRSGKTKIVDTFKEAFKSGAEVNLKSKDKFIYTTGGILTKLEGQDLYFAIKNSEGITKWVKIFE